MSTNGKRIHERWTFTRFCAAAGLETVDGSIEQPDDDPPDLRAHVAGYGPVAFELVRLNDPDDLKAKNRLGPGDKLFKASFAALEDSRRAALIAKYADGGITISFGGTASDRDRKAALAFLWQLLEELPMEHTGRVHLANHNAPPALTSLYVNRSLHSGGPHLTTIGIGGEFPLDLDQLKTKLVTRYSKAERLELIAYVDAGEIAFLGAIERIEELVIELLPQSSFCTVWVYEGLLDRVAFAVTGTQMPPNPSVARQARIK